MRYELLGPLQVIDDTVRTISAPKVETLLAALLIKANHSVSTEDLIYELWGEEPPRRARAALHVYISQLRKTYVQPAVDGASIRTHGQGYLLEADESVIDVASLQAWHTEGRALLETDPESALVRFRSAARLFRGPVLAGINNGLIIGAFVRWSEEIRLECLESLAHAALRVGRHREVIGDLTQWVDEYPLNETFREQLMLALHRAGRRAEALEVFQSGRKVLREELGLDPRNTMRKLLSAILEADTDYAIAG